MLIHVSFDFWTLFTPNQFFIEAAVKAFGDAAGLNEEEAVFDFNLYMENLQLSATTRGISFTPETIFGALGEQYGFDGEQLQATIERLFELMPPIAVKEAPMIFDYLRDADFSISVNSNTSLISGNMLNAHAKRILGQYHFGAYSDLIGASRPSPTFYRRIVDAVAIGAQVDVFPSSILIVTNDPFEALGAARCGLSTVSIQADKDVFAAVRQTVEASADNFRELLTLG